MHLVVDLYPVDLSQSVLGAVATQTQQTSMCVREDMFLMDYTLCFSYRLHSSSILSETDAALSAAYNNDLSADSPINLFELRNTLQVRSPSLVYIYSCFSLPG